MRVFNFSGGPAVLPVEVLERAKEELLDWHGKGMSVMEMSHRGKEFIAIAEQAEADFRELLKIPNQYKVLFLQGGATTQFSMVPMNLASGQMQTDHLITGLWSKKAYKEAQKFSQAHIAASSESGHFASIPAQPTWQLNPKAAYLHYTPNETVNGVEFQWIPNVGGQDLVADMSSTILSRPLDVTKFALIYAGAQKNIGPAGLTVVIIKEELLGKASAQVPSMLDYKVHADADSMANTPPTYSWYMAGLVFGWIKQQGGLEAMAQLNRRKANKLYAVIDASEFYQNPVDKECRSWMNIPFTLASEDLNKAFLEGTEAAGLLQLKGHRSVGGMRASLYNAMPEDGVDALIEYMSEFERSHG
jgi:phosphoserine aminotransferase